MNYFYYILEYVSTYMYETWREYFIIYNLALARTREWAYFAGLRLQTVQLFT